MDVSRVPDLLAWFDSRHIAVTVEEADRVNDSVITGTNDSVTATAPLVPEEEPTLFGGDTQ